MVEPLKPKMTLKVAELQDGDIVCIQLDEPLEPKSHAKPESDAMSGMSVSTLTDQLSNTDFGSIQPAKSSDSTSVNSYKTAQSPDAASVNSWKTAQSSDSLKTVSSTPGISDRMDDARQYYDFLLYKKEVEFHPHPTRNAHPEEYQPFKLVLMSKMSYDQFASRVGQKLGIDPTHLRFWTVNQINGNPKNSVKRGQSINLGTILNPPYSSYSNNNQRSDALYFEVLDMSLSELDTKRAIRVFWISEGTSKDVSISQVSVDF